MTMSRRPTMGIWAIIPVKSLRESKRRLAHLLSADERAQLIERFLHNALAALNRATAVHATIVISSDPVALAAARRHGAHALAETAPCGLNTDVAEAVAFAVAQAAAGVLILPADLPFLRAADVEAMLAVAVGDENGRAPAARQPYIAICTDAARNGTNALLLCPPAGFAFHYGPGSFSLHAAEARRRGMLVYEVCAPGLQFDLDTEADWLACRDRVDMFAPASGP